MSVDDLSRDSRADTNVVCDASNCFRVPVGKMLLAISGGGEGGQHLRAFPSSVELTCQ